MAEAVAPTQYKSVGTRGDGGGRDFSNTLLAERQQGTKRKRTERKNDYAEQSQNIKGLHIGQS